MAEKRRRSCQDIQVALAGDNGSEDTSFAVELVQEEGPVRSCLGSCCIIFSSIMAWSMVLGRTSCACIGKSTVQEGLDPAARHCALRVGHPSRPRSCCLPLVLRVRPPPFRNLPRGAPGQVGSRRLVAVASVRRQARSMALVQDVQTVPATQNQNTGSGRQGCSLLSERTRTSASLQPTVPFQPGLHLQGPPSQSVWLVSPHRVRFFTRASISPHAVWNLCAPAAFWLRNQQQRPFNVDGSQAVGSRCSGMESPREEFACASRPLGTHCGRKRCDPGSYCGTARPRRGGARTVSGARGLPGSALSDTANRAAHRSKTGGAGNRAATFVRARSQCFQENLWVTARFRTAPDPGRRPNCRDGRLLPELRLGDGTPAMCGLSTSHGLGRKSRRGHGRSPVLRSAATAVACSWLRSPKVLTGTPSWNSGFSCGNQDKSVF